MFTKKAIDNELKMTRLRSDVDWVANETRKINNLFAKDRHGTMRPKVDILTDECDRNRTDVLDAISRLFRKIEKIEEWKK